MLVRGEGGDREMKTAWKINRKACKLRRPIGCKRADELDKVFHYTNKYKPKKRK